MALATLHRSWRPQQAAASLLGVQRSRSSSCRPETPPRTRLTPTPTNTNPTHNECKPCLQGDTEASKFYVLERGAAEARIFRDEWGEERTVLTYSPGRYSAVWGAGGECVWDSLWLQQAAGGGWAGGRVSSRAELRSRARC